MKRSEQLVRLFQIMADYRECSEQRRIELRAEFRALIALTKFELKLT
jgi:hypothetical protein